MTNRYCVQCGWETPSYAVYTRIKKKPIVIGYMCSLCGRVYTHHFPQVYLLRNDALAIKAGLKSFDEFRPGYRAQQLPQESVAPLAKTKH
ncbi:MAG: hypothetical protein ACFE9L_09245 [Candidatus Hodarchaeota archaeon]